MLKQAESSKFAILFAVLLCSTAAAQTTVNGNSLAYKSTGSASGSAWNLDRNGYVGTYITLASPGTVTIKVNATGTAGSGIAPNVSVAIADSIRGFSVGSTTGDYSNQFTLPAGTHFVRTQFDNDLALTSRQVKINSLTVTGASVANSANSANALAASDTYIANYRKGDATVQLGLPAGTAAQVRLKKLAFAWGTVAPGSGSGVNNYLGSNNTTQQKNYQSRLLANFNALGMENAGKWNDTEATRGKPTMGGVDSILNFAAANNLTARAHTLAYDLDQNDPKWVNDLRAKAVKTASAKTDLRNAISSRINYYATPARMAKVDAIDVFNESYQSQTNRGKSSYYSLFGASGFAGVFDELNRKMGDVPTKLYVNEYNSLIYPYGNAAGYLGHIENLQRAGTAVEGIGTQHYPWSLSMHSPSDILKAMQTYNVTGLPQTITELGAYTDNGLTSSQAATILGDVMRLAFGNPNSTGVYLWGFHRENGGGNLFAPGLALFDVNTKDWSKWTLTAAGKVWQERMAAWTTNATTTVGADGAVRFNGFFGDYELTAGGKAYQFSHGKPVGLVMSATPEPSALVLVLIAAVIVSMSRIPASMKRTGWREEISGMERP